MIKTANPLLGIVKYGDDQSFIDIWQLIHSNANAWNNISDSKTLISDRSTIDENISSFYPVVEQIPSIKWLSFCTAAGMTVYGAVALSWCKDAKIEQVWDGWEASGFPLKPLPEFERPARFINPDLLPKTSSLAQIIAFSPDKTLPICAMIAALKEPLVFDLPADHLKNANPQIASFLKSRMEQKTDRTPEQDDLISIWTQTTKDTEWEI